MNFYECCDLTEKSISREDSNTVWELETYFIYQLGSFFCEEKCNARKSCQRGKKTSLLCFYLYSLFPEKWDCLDLGHGE